MMAQFSPRLDHSAQKPIDLEPELHEGDGKVPFWIWIIVSVVTLFGVVAAPFQWFWPFG